MKPYYHDERAGIMIYHGDAFDVLPTLPDCSIQCCITSPPYWGLRDYQVDGQLGLEKTPEEYVAKMVSVFREVRRVLRDDGTLWLNLGDSYAGSNQGHGTKELSEKQASNTGTQWMVGKDIARLPDGLKSKDLIGIPWRVAFALQADDWWLRQDIIWHKPNPMPESVKDRCCKSHEYVFLMAKRAKYFYDNEAVREPTTDGDPTSPRGSKGAKSPNAGLRTGKSWHDHGADFTEGQSQKKNLPNLKLETRNRRSVWTIPTQPFPGAHFATFPEKLVEPCIMAGCPAGGVVLDPFAGANTVGVVAKRLGRKYIGIELKSEYIDMSIKRLAQGVLDLA